MASDSADLLAGLEQAVALLRQHGEDRWAAWLEKDRQLIAAEDFRGVEHLLEAYGGAGSFNDLVLADTAANAQLQSLRSRLYEIGTSLRRARARP